MMDRELVYEQEQKQEEKYVNPKQREGRILRVFVDEQEDKKYISMFAAYELYLITYEQACNNPNGLYEISDYIIKQVEEEGCAIEYVILENKNNQINYYKEKDILNQHIKFENYKNEFSNIKDENEKQFISKILKDKAVDLNKMRNIYKK